MRDSGLRSLLPLCSLKSKRFAEKCFDAACSGVQRPFAL